MRLLRDLLLFCATALCIHAAAEAIPPPNQVIIPSIPQPLRLVDFGEGMEPRPELRSQLGHIDHFTQQQPSDGKQSSERTEAWFGYTREKVYIAFVCYDAHPAQIRAHLARRERILDDDYVQVIFDAFRDHRRGFLFAVNPLGVQADALFTDDQTEPDFSYDQVWDSEGHLTSQGWVAILAIPFKSLRFRAGEGTWGIVLMRDLQRNSEQDFWPRVSSSVTGILSQEGSFAGFEGMSPSHNFQFDPYTLLHNLRQLNTRDPARPYFQDRTLQGTGGGDGKVVVHDSLVLDATYNPDFSQIGSDEPQFNVNQRFEVYYPERRPFFLENANYFTTPINLVFTRRIGDPQYGGRLTGKLGKLNLGFLMANDRRPGNDVADNDPAFGHKARFSIARLSRDIGKQSSLGIIYTDREFGSTFNRVGGLDTRLLLTPNWTATGQFVVSSTSQLDGSYQAGPASAVTLRRDGRQFTTNFIFEDFSPGFVAETGYVQRTDLRHYGGRAQYHWRPEGKYLISHGPTFISNSGFDHEGNRLFTYNEIDYFLRFKYNTLISPVVEYNSDTLRPVDFSGLTKNTNYSQDYVGIFAQSSPFPALTLNLSAIYGGNVDYLPAAGHLPFVMNEDSVQLFLTVQPARALTIENTFLLDRDLSRKDGHLVFDSETFRSQVNYQFTKALSARAIVQFQPVAVNSLLTAQPRTKELSQEYLFTWLPHPGTAIYVGYNNDLQNIDRSLCYHLATGGCDPNNTSFPRSTRYLTAGREAFVKFSYLLRF